MRQKDSDDLVRVGPGTTMGNLMRQYWLPAAMSSELKSDGEPMRLMLLGEKLIAFRDSSGRVTPGRWIIGRRRTAHPPETSITGRTSTPPPEAGQSLEMSRA